MTLVRAMGVVLVGAGLAWAAGGCQAAHQAEGRDAQADKALSRSQPAPPPAEPNAEPRPEFHQEAPGSQ